MAIGHAGGAPGSTRGLFSSVHDARRICDRRLSHNTARSTRAAGTGTWLTLLFLLVLAVLPTPANAQFATGGVGIYRDNIVWLAWGNVNDLINATTTRVNVVPVAGQFLRTTCTLSALNGPLVVRTPTGRGLGALYNDTGVGATSNMPIALYGGPATTRIFNVACSATFGPTGTAADPPYAINGLVYADAEQNASGAEWEQGNPVAGGATWRIIERYRPTGCTPSAVGRLTAPNVLTVFGSASGFCSPGAPGEGQGPMAMAFVENATTISVTLRGAGVSGIALGVFVNVSDQGDAPASYGDPQHLPSFVWSGGTLPLTSPATLVNLNDPAFVLGTQSPAAVPRFGATADTEITPLHNAAAAGDDADGIDDEDGIPGAGPIIISGGTLNGVLCTGTGQAVRGFIDWNADGDFDDPGEASVPTTCPAGGSANLTWSTPGALEGPSYLRLRIAFNASEIASPTGVAGSGEVEDYAVTLIPSQITLVKQLNGRVSAADQFTVSIENPTPVSVTTTGSGVNGTSTVSTAATPVDAGTPIVLRDALTAGTGVFGTYIKSIDCVANAGNAGAVPVISGPVVGGTTADWTLTPNMGNDLTCTITNAAPDPTFTISKALTGESGSEAGVAEPGELLTYTITTTNTSDVDAEGVLITDPIPANTAFVSASDGGAVVGSDVQWTLDLAASTAVTRTVVFQVADPIPVGATQIANSATVDDPSDTTPAATCAVLPCASMPVASPALTLVKTAVAGDPYDTLGGLVSYQYVVTNTGNVTINALAVTDDKIATVSCPVTTLAPGASTTCTGTYTITLADLDAGSVTNNASATGTPVGGTLVPATDNETVTGTALPAFTLDKTAVAGDPYDIVGDVVSYEYLVTNTGNVTINALAVTDDKIATVTCPVTTLAAGASTICTGTYTVLQADLDAGLVTNNATATATPVRGTLGPATDSVTVTSSATPSLRLVKTAVAGAPYDAVGDVVSYEYLVTNPSSITINAVAVTDDKIATVTCPVTTLAPGASTTCTGTYTITQADLDAGSVTNNAIATGTPTSGTLVPGTDDETVNATATPALTLVKTAVAGAPYDTVGDVVGYEYLVTNTGNVTINALTVSDDKIATVTCPVTTLAPGASTTCTGTYTITQADLDAGSVTNNATAAGTPVGGVLVPATDDETATATATPALTLDKTAVAGAPYSTVGETVSYEYLVTNTGNVTIDALVVTDDKIATVTCPATTLAPAASTTCTAFYTITQADLDAGTLTNNASATGTPASGTLTPATDSVTVNALPLETYSKSANTAGPVGVGDTITYTLSVTIAYAATLDPLTLTDTLGPGLDFGAVTSPGAYTCNGGSPLACTLPAGTAPGTYALSYTAIVNAQATGTVTNAVVAEPPVPGTNSPSCAGSCSTSTPVAAPAVTYAKVANTAGPVAMGDVITYTLTTTVANSQTTDGVTLTDTLGAGLDFGAVTNAGAYSCNAANPLVCTLPAGTLPGSYAVTYTATVNANAAGTVANAVVGTGPDNPTCSADCSIDTPVVAPTITVAKSSDPAIGTEVEVGQAIQYTLIVTVSNSATLADVVLVDTPDSGLTITDVPPGCVASGATLTCTLPAGSPAGVHTFAYTATVNDQAGATVGNVVTATSAGGQPQPTCTSCATTHQVVASELRLAKVAAVREVHIGDLIRYTLTAENVGAGSLRNGSVVDTPPAGFSYVEGSVQVVDGDNQGTVEGQSPLRFGGLDIAGGQTATLTYLMRVGAGVRPGIHQNRAQAFSPTTGEPISNVATAQVELVADPLLDDSLILGTVFDDRDRDGWQDRADLRDVRVQGGFAPGAYIAGSTTVDRGTGAQPEPDASAPLLHGVAVDAISARQSDADPVDNHQVVIRQRLNALTFTNDFVLTSAEGVTVRMDAAGNTTVEKTGEAAKGLNAAAPTVERRIAQGEGGYVVDYVIGNAGVDERGIPGVRIASVEGLLIETDQFGRYHLVGMPGGPWERGRNFILKVDPSTLPAGAEFTTDNPLLRRITPGLPVRFDFGVKLPVQVIEGGTEQVEMKLGDVFFAPGSAEVRSQYLPVIEKIAAKVREYHGGEVVIDANGDTEGLAFDRAMAVKQALLAVLDAESAKGLVISARGHVDDPSSLVVGVDEGGALFGTVLFDTDKSTIRPEFEPLLDKVAAALDRMGGGSIAIVGHTDVRASYEYNVALGMRRAKAVYDALAKRLSPAVRAKVRVDVRNDPTAPAGTERKQGEQGS